MWTDEAMPRKGLGTYGQRPTFSALSRKMSHMNKKMNRREAMAGAAAIAGTAAVPAVPGIAVPRWRAWANWSILSASPSAICWGRMQAASDAARFLV